MRAAKNSAMIRAFIVCHPFEPNTLQRLLSCLPLSSRAVCVTLSLSLSLSPVAVFFWRENAHTYLCSLSLCQHLMSAPCALVSLSILSEARRVAGGGRCAAPRVATHEDHRGAPGPHRRGAASPRAAAPAQDHSNPRPRGARVVLEAASDPPPLVLFTHLRPGTAAERHVVPLIVLEGGESERSPRAAGSRPLGASKPRPLSHYSECVM